MMILNQERNEIKNLNKAACIYIRTTYTGTTRKEPSDRFTTGFAYVRYRADRYDIRITKDFSAGEDYEDVAIYYSEEEVQKAFIGLIKAIRDNQPVYEMPKAKAKPTWRKEDDE